MSALRRYHRVSREFGNSLILTAPIFVLYQIGILFTDGWRNGVDLFSGPVMRLLGGSLLGYTVLNLLILGVFVGLYLKRREERTLDGRTWALLIVESTAWAVVMGLFAGNLLFQLGFRPPLAAGLEAIPAATGLPAMGVFDAFVLSLGAGAWEELFFRLILLGGMLWGFRRLGWRPWVALATALVLSSVIFSAFHYVPIGMESWQVWSFMFRFVLGIFLGVLYLWRGFAVAVYAHAIYDILILVPRAIVGG
ncbi:MAG: CPBP family intramembrane metalloprotease [Deltaproteobacteria bacterium]|nr:MAG: CPBP family intramembrane metalloprotease [Deltaproteobacteria bacterium]